MHGTKSGMNAETYFPLAFKAIKMQNITEILNDASILPNKNVGYTRLHIETAVRNKIGGHIPFITCVRRGNFYDIVEMRICINEKADYIQYPSPTISRGLSNSK